MIKVNQVFLFEVKEKDLLMDQGSHFFLKMFMTLFLLQFLTGTQNYKVEMCHMISEGCKLCFKTSKKNWAFAHNI